MNTPILSIFNEQTKSFDEVPAIKGSDGSKWFTGDTAPDVSLGVKGDFYLHKNGDYFQKVEDVWALKGNLVSEAPSTPIIDNLTSTFTTAALSANQGRALDVKKVEKETGKGLSQENFTSIEKTKLSDLQNYDDEGLRTQLSSRVGIPVYDKLTHTITFTTVNGATGVIDLPIEQIGLTYDTATKTMRFKNAAGEIQSVPLSDFVDIYVGFVGTQIKTEVDSGNVIKASIVDGSIDMTKLSTTLQALINNKVDKVTGKALSTNNFTNELKTQLQNSQLKLSAANEGANIKITEVGGVPKINAQVNIQNLSISQTLFISDGGALIENSPTSATFSYVLAGTTPATSLFLYLPTKDLEVSRDSNYLVYLNLSGANTSVTYNITCRWRLPSSIVVSEGMMIYRPLFASAMICIPMLMNFVNTPVKVKAGEVLTLQVIISKNTSDNSNISIISSQSSPSAIVRNGGNITANSVTDKYEGITTTQSQINLTLYNAIKTLQDQVAKLTKI